MISRYTNIVLKKVSLATDILAMAAFFTTSYLILSEALEYNPHLHSEASLKTMFAMVAFVAVVKLVDVVCIGILNHNNYAPGILPTLLGLCTIAWYGIIIIGMYRFGLLALLMSVGCMIVTSLAFKAIYIYLRLQLAKTTNQYLYQVI